MTVLRLQSDGRNTKATLQQDIAKPPWAWFLSRIAYNSMSSKGRRMANAWTKEALEYLYIGVNVLLNYSSLTAAKSSIALLFLQSASWIELLLGGGPL